MQGSAAISSDAYFGREQRSAGPSGAGGSGVDLSAGDLVNKIGMTARQDMDSIKQVTQFVVVACEGGKRSDAVSPQARRPAQPTSW